MSTYDYDHIVIGSGFGGSVAALRLAQKGFRVLLIEAGKRWKASDLPRSSWQLRKYLWKPALRLFGIQRIDFLRHVAVLSGAGVGGGSLIYGNTLFVPLAPFFERPEIQALGGALELLPYYKLAERMMGVVPNPHLTPADEILRETAAEYGRADTFTPSPVGVFFGDPEQETADPYFQGEGPARSGCRLCGGCFLGCRYNAKNSLDRNYLPLAESLGVEIRAETHVTRIQPLSPNGSEGYRIHTKSSTSWRGRPHRSFTTQSVVVSAGVLGTLKLLHRARDRGDLPNLSPQLGERVRTNSESIVGVRARDRRADFSRGLAASSSVFPDEHTQIQADRYPAGSDSMSVMSTLLVDGGGRIPRWLRFIGCALRRPLDFFRVTWPFGFARQSVLLVVMQTLEGHLRINRRRRWWWPFGRVLDSEIGSDGHTPTYIPIANDFARRMAQRMKGVPISSTPEVLRDTPATAHILGGCPIGTSPEEGVIDEQHRVFGYENLRICDGTVIPANLGVNPALSILAFSERALSFVPPKEGDGAGITHLRVDESWEVKALLTRPQPTSSESQG